MGDDDPTARVAEAPYEAASAGEGNGESFASVAATGLSFLSARSSQLFLDARSTAVRTVFEGEAGKKYLVFVSTANAGDEGAFTLQIASNEGMGFC